MKLIKALYAKALLFQREKPLLFGFSLLVFLLHMTLFAISFFQKPFIKTPNVRSLKVQTICLKQEPKKKVVVKTAAPAAQKKKVVKKNTKQKRKTAPKKKIQKKITPSKTAKLVSEVQKSLSQLESSPPSSNSLNSLSLPKPIGELKTSSYKILTENLDEKAIEYHSLLSEALKRQLSLPAYGTVKVKAKLSAEGTLLFLTVVYSDSEVNRLYIEKELPNASLPSFVGPLAERNEYVFSLTFCSDDD